MHWDILDISQTKQLMDKLRNQLTKKKCVSCSPVAYEVQTVMVSSQENQGFFIFKKNLTNDELNVVIAKIILMHMDTCSL